MKWTDKINILTYISYLGHKFKHKNIILMKGNIYIYILLLLNINYYI